MYLPLTDARLFVREADDLFERLGDAAGEAKHNAPLA